MLSKPKACSSCLGYKWDDGDGFIRPEGTGRLGIHIVGEAAGKNEAVDGLPFRPYAQAGSILTQCIKRAEAGLDRSDFFIHNVLSCKPPGDLLAGQWYEEQVIRHCEVHRRVNFKSHPPKVILALGATAFKTLTGYSGEEKETLSMMRGYPLQITLLGRKVWVVPSFHPAYIARGKRSLIPVLIHDIRRALDVAKHGWKIEKKDYILYPSIGDAKNFLQSVIAQPEAMLSFDLENPNMHDDSEDWKDDEEELIAPEDKDWEELKKESEMSREKAFLQGKKYAAVKTIQFSIKPGTGICLPWVGDYINFAKAILALPNPKIGQNVYRYDLPVLRENEIPVNGHIHDLMWMMHHLRPDLEGCYHLQGICSFYGADEPWKHKAGTNHEYYGCEDVSNPLKAIRTLIPEMKSTGVWNSYLSHITELRKPLDAASKKGLLYDVEGGKKLSIELGEEMAALLLQMRELCPDEVRLPKQKDGYAVDPKNTEGMVQREFTIREKIYSTYRVPCVCVDGKTPKGKPCGRCDGSGKRIKRVWEKKQKGKEFVVTRWCKLKPFVPSHKQLIRYMECQGHSVPKHARTSKPTADERALKLLSNRTKDPMYPIAIECKGIHKLKSSYVDSWKTWNDGRIHTTFGFHPSTGQLNSRDPNVQQLPKHRDIADRFRQLIICPKNTWLVEMDYHSFHGMTCGFEAEDKDYLRLAQIDLHAYLTSDMVGKRADTRWNDKKLTQYLKEIRAAYPEIRDTKAKRAILGYQFGMTGYLLWQMWREIYEKQKDAEEAIARIDALFPKQVAYRNRTVDEAWTRKHLKTRYGYIRWFWDAKKYEPRKRTYVWAEDAKKAIAYRPANDAHAMMKERMLYLAGLPTIAYTGSNPFAAPMEKDLLAECGFLMPYHDALIFEMSNKQMDRNIETVQRAMEAPDPLLKNSVAPSGLAVKVDVKIGSNLGKEAMKKWEALRKQQRRKTA